MPSPEWEMTGTQHGHSMDVDASTILVTVPVSLSPTPAALPTPAVHISHSAVSSLNGLGSYSLHAMVLSGRWYAMQLFVAQWWGFVTMEEVMVSTEILSSSATRASCLICSWSAMRMHVCLVSY
jgi:hypothetical protein